MYSFIPSFWKKITIFFCFLFIMAPRGIRGESDSLRVICHVAMPWVIGNQVAEPLIYVDNDNQFIPCLAESYQMNDTYTDMRLRKNVMFQDGTRFDASSVIMNWEIYRRTAKPYFTIDIREGVEDMEAVSPYHIKIRFRNNGLIGLIPVYLRSFYIYSPSYFRHSGEIYPPGNQANMSEAGPWGTGPYMLKEISPEKGTAVLEKFPSYWQKGRPETKTIFMYGTRKYDSTAAHRLIKLGEADLFDAVKPSMLHVILAQSPEIHMKVRHPLSYLTTLFNMRKADSPLRDIRVRKALNLLIDRKTLFKYLSHETGRMTPFIFPLSPEGLQPYPYDPETAGKLLHEAGYGQLSAASDHLSLVTEQLPARSNGQRLRRELSRTTTDNGQNSLSITIGYFISEEKLAYAIAAMLEEGGIRVKFQKYNTRYEWYQHVMEYGHTDENPMESETWDLNIVNTGLYTNSAATHFGESFVSRGGYRWILPDSQADEMFFRAMRQRDPRAGEALLKDMEKYLYSQYYMMPVYIQPTILAVHKRIAESSLSASGYLLNLKEVSCR
ncbi:ABC transporter substrate-binding protein [Desulfococcaceae bacterium HSG8]|nr:ABC transporter substrate-binding protein [Desulfococcaceae bacterium HSG8]